MPPKTFLRIAAPCLAIAVLAPAIARAELGAPLRARPSATAAAQQLPASRPASAAPAVYESRSIVDGSEVVEFAGPDMVVFAVSWRGPAIPDMSSILGPFAERRALAQSRSFQAGFRLGSRSGVNDPEFITETYGMPGSLRGWAAIPSMIPQGFDMARLRP